MCDVTLTRHTTAVLGPAAPSGTPQDLAMLPKMCGAAAQLLPSARRAAIRQVLRCSAAAASLPLVPHSCVTGAAGCWEVAHTPAASNYGALVTGGARGLCSVALDSGDAGPGYVTIMTPDGQSQEVSDDIDSKTSEAALVFNEGTHAAVENRWPAGKCAAVPRVLALCAVCCVLWLCRCLWLLLWQWPCGGGCVAVAVWQHD